MHKRVLVLLDSSAVLDSVVSAILKFAGVARVEVALLRVMRAASYGRHKGFAPRTGRPRVRADG